MWEKLSRIYNRKTKQRKKEQETCGGESSTCIYLGVQGQESEDEGKASHEAVIAEGILEPVKDSIHLKGLIICQ